MLTTCAAVFCIAPPASYLYNIIFRESLAQGVESICIMSILNVTAIEISNNFFYMIVKIRCSEKSAFKMVLRKNRHVFRPYLLMTSSQ